MDARLWFWHAFFGTAGCQNDIVILDRSPLLVDLMHGIAPEVTFQCNGNTYSRGYYLTDGKFPEWAMFMKPISKPEGEKKKITRQDKKASAKRLNELSLPYK